VARHIFQAGPVWIYTQSNITNIIVWCLEAKHNQVLFNKRAGVFYQV
jgi:hypothetical protein